MKGEWEDDFTQFARLLAEINMTQENLDYKELCKSMDLPKERIDELFDRAMEVFEADKERIFKKLKMIP